MTSGKELAVDKIETYRINGKSELFLIKIDGNEIVAFNREESEEVIFLLQGALKKKRRLTMNTNVDGAIITPEAIQTVKFLQQENYVDETLNQINEVIDIVIAEDIPAILDSDKDCLRIVRNLRYLAQHISTFKKPINHG